MASTYGNVGVTIEPLDILQSTPATVISFAPNSAQDVVPPTTLIVSVNTSSGNVTFG